MSKLPYLSKEFNMLAKYTTDFILLLILTDYCHNYYLDYKKSSGNKKQQSDNWKYKFTELKVCSLCYDIFKHKNRKSEEYNEFYDPNFIENDITPFKYVKKYYYIDADWSKMDEVITKSFYGHNFTTLYKHCLYLKEYYKDEAEKKEILDTMSAWFGNGYKHFIKYAISLFELDDVKAYQKKIAIMLFDNILKNFISPKESNLISKEIKELITKVSKYKVKEKSA